MLKPKVIRDILDQVLGGGVKSSILLTTSGDTLGSAGNEPNEKLVGAIVLNIWSSYQKSSPGLSCLLVDCEEGKLAVSSVASRFLVCCYGDQRVQDGMLKRKIDTLCSYLQGPLSSLSTADRS